MKIYLAGRIAGDRKYRAKFREATRALEGMGHVVLNPATLPDGLTDRKFYVPGENGYEKKIREYFKKIKGEPEEE